MPTRKQSRKLSGGRSGRKLSGGRKVRTGPRGGKYVLRAGKKVYLSGGLACSTRNKEKNPKCEEEPGCKWIDGRKPGCVDPVKQAKKKEPAAAAKKKSASKQEVIKHKKLMNTLEVLDDKGNHMYDSNEAYFRDLFKSRDLWIDITHEGLEINTDGTSEIYSSVNDGDNPGWRAKDWPSNALKVIFSNLHHFKHLENLELNDQFASESGYDWVKGKRPPKLKRLVIGEFTDVPSSFTNGLDELVIGEGIEEVPQHWIKDQLFKHVHKKVRKVVFNNFNKKSYDKELEKDQRQHDKNIAYLRRQFPDSDIVFRDEDDIGYVYVRFDE